MTRCLLILIVLSAYCVWHVSSSRRIVGGDEVGIESYPWTVSIQQNGTHCCGGTIYSMYIIITAAQCLQRVGGDFKDLKVRVGSTNWRQGGALHHVASLRIHERYNPLTMDNDVALIRVSENIIFGYTTRNIALTESPPPQGALAHVSGWGVPYYGASTMPTSLRAVAVNIVREAQCLSSEYGYGEKAIKNSMICAAASNRDACQGDTGGPLVFEGVLVGIVSWGFGCALPKYPGVYACAYYARDWIIKNAKDLEAATDS